MGFDSGLERTKIQIQSNFSAPQLVIRTTRSKLELVFKPEPNLRFYYLCVKPNLGPRQFQFIFLFVTENYCFLFFSFNYFLKTLLKN